MGRASSRMVEVVRDENPGLPYNPAPDSIGAKHVEVECEAADTRVQLTARPFFRPENCALCPDYVRV